MEVYIFTWAKNIKKKKINWMRIFLLVMQISFYSGFFTTYNWKVLTWKRITINHHLLTIEKEHNYYHMQTLNSESSCVFPIEQYNRIGETVWKVNIERWDSRRQNTLNMLDVLYLDRHKFHWTIVIVVLSFNNFFLQFPSILCLWCDRFFFF